MTYTVSSGTLNPTQLNCIVHYIVCAARQLCRHVMFDVCVTVCFTSQFYYAYHQLNQVSKTFMWEKLWGLFLQAMCPTDSVESLNVRHQC